MDTKRRSEIQQAFDLGKEKATAFRTSSIKERKAYLSKIHDWIISNRSEIQKALFQDLQKPTQESDLTEIFVVLSEIRLAKANLNRWSRPKKEETSITYLGSNAQTYYEPKGCCLIISPWNYPFQLAISPLVSAIAAGNTAIIKPSEFSANTSALIKRMCEELFHDNEVVVFLGAVEESQELLSLSFDHIFFTGSPKVGKIVMKAAAENLASVTLELGGKSPTIVDETANIKDAAQKIAWGKWQNAGQICIAPDYLFVHESKYEDFTLHLISYVKKLYQNEEQYGGIISEEHHDRLNKLLMDAIDKGASVLHGGTSDQASIRFSPTILAEVSTNSTIMQEEIFGPLLPIFTYQNLGEVINFINEKPKPLALYLFSKSRKNKASVMQQTSSGMLTINDAVIQFAHPHLPIGGVNNSGIGKAHGHAGFLAFSNEKAVLKQRIGFTMAKSVYPPYSTFKNFIINIMVKYF